MYMQTIMLTYVCMYEYVIMDTLCFPVSEYTLCVCIIWVVKLKTVMFSHIQ